MKNVQPRTGMNRPVAGAGTPTGHGLKKFDGGPEQNKALKSAFRKRAQDASADGAGHPTAPRIPSPGSKSMGGERVPCPQA